jgi:hypothetical protein
LPVRRSDEAETLVIVEPLNCSVGTHTVSLFVLLTAEVRYFRTNR